MICRPFNTRRRAILLPLTLFVFLALTALNRFPRQTAKIGDVPAQSEISYSPQLGQTPIEDNFPSASFGGGIPGILTLNAAAALDSNRRHTPLFIGFTRSWPQLQQTVVAYLTAGWPKEEILVVDNSGVMDANVRDELSLQNPFYLNHNRLDQLGIKVLQTPTLLTFSQLQNFFISTAISRNWTYFFWSHQDVVPLTEEHLKPYKSFYARVLECLDGIPEDEKWAVRFFSFDWLTLVSVDAMREVGGWDPQIPFYMTDCDMYERLTMLGFSQNACRAGLIYDLAEPMADLSVLYPASPDEPPNSQRYKNLVRKLYEMQKAKEDNTLGRNTWQLAQSGGHGEPFYRDPAGFDKALHMWIDFGRTVFWEKWGHGECDLFGSGRTIESAWTTPHDWE